MFKDKTILVTGGTGTFGQAFTKYLFENHDVKKLIIFSRDEFKQYEMSKIFPKEQYPIRYFIGDVRDKQRLEMAFRGVDYVIHAAAVKHVPACEYNPSEAIKTNIFGAQNIIETAISHGVKRAVAISTDKAVAPTNLYGATKLSMEKLFLTASNYAGATGTEFAVVRYGNVWASRGSIVPKFLDLHKQGITEFPVTDAHMTRFNIMIEEGVQLVLMALLHIAAKNSIIVPQIPSFLITDLVKAINPTATIKIIGIRQGEKIHETLISTEEGTRTETLGDRYLIRRLGEAGVGLPVRLPFSYDSGSNEKFLSVEDLQQLIRKIR